MSRKIISQEKDPVENLFWVFAIHYQILLMLKSDVGINVGDLNAGVKTAVPNRSIPEEAYAPANVSQPTYTLEDLLAQITEDNLHDEVDTGPAVRFCFLNTYLSHWLILLIVLNEHYYIALSYFFQKFTLKKPFLCVTIVSMERTNSVTTKNILNITKSSASRIALVESRTPDAIQKLCQDYWTWHFDESLSDAARLLLSTDLGWEAMPQLITPPVGEVISPLGYALAHEDKEVRDAALQALDVSVNIRAGRAYVGEESEPLEIDEFQIGVYPVTNAQYQRFVQDTGHMPPQDWIDGIYAANRGDHPVVWVTCDDAEAYARYAGGRLPTFPEWQYAARGADDRLFPWGYEIDKPRCNTAELGAGTTTPVVGFRDGISPFGCYDMVGNVWEWTDTPYDDDGNFRVACGGAWYYNHDYSTCTSYDFFSTGYAEFVIGFRIAY